MVARWIGCSVCLFSLGLMAGGDLSESTAATVTKIYDASGFLYGTLELKDGTQLTGLLRWDDEEQFWDDHFNGVKSTMPYQVHLPGDEDEKADKRGGVRLFGISLGDFKNVWRSRHAKRQFLANFGDMAKIEAVDADRATIVMKNNKHYGVSRSGDLGEPIEVIVRGELPRTVVWSDIQTVVFKPTPPDFPTAKRRLYGTVVTREGTYRGFIQWDREECLLADVLDGRDPTDGKHAIPFGQITRIQQDGGRRSKVTLRDGRTLVLAKSNDVNRDNRGIDVQDERYGRVRIDWKAFERIDFADQPHSGRGYGSFNRQSELHGKVWNKAGERFMGRIVFDLDESERWEVLDGDLRRISFMIPFGEVTKITPKNKRRCHISLRNGQQMMLGRTTDVTNRNNGLLIYEYNDKGPVYLPWKDVKHIDFNTLGE